LGVGCGIGDFAQFLIQSGVAFKHFHGIQIVDAASFIEKIKE
jgi:hypothetical protein